MEAVKYEGLQWHKKQKDSKIGAQELLISQTKFNNLFKVVHYKHGHMWTILESPEKLLQSNVGLYEIIQSQYPRKVYFEFEIWDDPECLNKAVKLITHWLPDAVLNISGSIQDTQKYEPKDILRYFKNPHPGGIRYSYHIVAGNHYPENVSDQECPIDFCKSQQDVLFDTSVYSRNQSMKCINQSKAIPGQKWSPFIQKYHSGSKNLLDHLICRVPKDAKNALGIFEIFSKQTYEAIKKVNKCKNKRVQIGALKSLKSISGLELPSLFQETAYYRDHETFFRILLYCVKYDISFEDFWTWCLKYGFTDKEDANKQWDYVLKKYSKDAILITHGSLLAKLRVHYPNIYKDYEERIFADFANVSMTKEIKKQYLVPEDLETNKTCVYLMTQMGTGKTDAVLKYRRMHPEFTSSCIITCRRSLASSLKERAYEYVHYQDYEALKKIAVERNLSTKKLNNIASQSLVMPYIKDLIITPNSSHYLQNSNFDLLIIDEVELYMFSWTSPETHRDKFIENWNIMNKLIKNAKKLIIMDALPSYKKIRYLEKLGIPESEIEFVDSSIKAQDIPIYDINKYKTVKKKNIQEVSESIKRFLQGILQDLEEGRKLYIFWPFKKNSGLGSNAEKLKNQSCTDIDTFIKMSLKERNIMCKSLVYTSDSEIEVLEGLKSVDSVWKDVNYIITNQIITVGVNCSIPFDNIYIADANV